MTRKAALAALIVVAIPVLAAAEEPRQPLVITDETVGLLRQHQAGSLILPKGKPPFPAVVVLHGCNGISQNTRVWARRLASWGYAALIVDSFSPRGLRQVCDGSRALPGPRRALDAFAGAKYLRSRSDIDGNRIAALGYSHGGWTALWASTEKAVARAQATPFRAAVAFYPYCPKVAPPLANDVQIFIGDADDWSSASQCSALVEKYGAMRRTAHRWSSIPARGIPSMRTGRTGCILATIWRTMPRPPPTHSSERENFSTSICIEHG